ncbi:MAG: fused MFS/spermidine synthase [Spirochaetota bacterium]
MSACTIWPFLFTLFTISSLQCQVYSDNWQSLPDGDIESRISPYNHTVIVKRKSNVYLYFVRKGKRYLESSMSRKNPYSLPIPYTQLFTVGYLYPEKIRSLLMLGVGGGTFTTYTHHYMPKVHIDAVDIDGEVLAMAKKYFYLQEDSRYRLHTQDAAKYLKNTQRKYDLVYADTYRGGFIPQHLLQESYFRSIHNRLYAKGCLVINIGYTNNYKQALPIIRKLYSYVDLYKYPHRENRVLVACKGKVRLSREKLLQRAKGMQRLFHFTTRLNKILPYRKQF